MLFIESIKIVNNETKNKKAFTLNMLVMSPIKILFLFSTTFLTDVDVGSLFKSIDMPR